MGKRFNRNKETEFWNSAYMNNRTYLQYYNRLMELAISMFEWKNVPETIDTRFIELTLFAEGQALWFKDDELGKDGNYLCLQMAVNGGFDVYRVPLRRRAYAVNGYQKQLDNKNSVIIYNNMIRTNSMLDVEMFAKRLYNIDRIIDVNVNAQKTPVLILADQNQRLTMKNLYKQYDGNEPFIFGDSGLSTTPIKAISTEAPYNADKLYTLKTQIWNEALTYLGISNTNTVKKERLISDEVMRSMGGVIASRYSRLNARKQACEKINAMFGLNIDVDYRQDYREADDEYMLAGQTESNDITAMVTDLRTRSNYE